MRSRIFHIADKLVDQVQEANTIDVSTYDQLLWTIVTAPRDELHEFALHLWEEPYHTLPAPILVAVWRVLGLESADDPETLRQCVAGIALHCDPEEEEHAVKRIRDLLHEAQQEGE